MVLLPFGFTLLDEGKGNKLDLKLEPRNEFTIEIEQSLVERGDDIKEKGSFKLELIGIERYLWIRPKSQS